MMEIINIKTPDTGRKQNIQICIDKRINKIFIHTPKRYAQTYIGVKAKHKTIPKLMTPASKIGVICFFFDYMITCIVSCISSPQAHIQIYV